MFVIIFIFIGNNIENLLVDSAKLSTVHLFGISIFFKTT